MDNERVILQSDMNSFYASVEMMLNPELKGKPVAVCGSTEERHGIVLAKSDLAKKAGVKTGMVNWEARQLCPGLIVVPPQYDQYLKYSKLARQIYHRYTDLVEPYGMDECWLDVTGSGVCGTGMEIAEAIRQTTKEELGLTVSIGVSFNKIFAKLGSDMRKPDAITEIKWDNFKEKIWPLDAAELLYVGRATENKLAQYGIRTIGDLAKTSPDTLQHMLGINGLKLWMYANGTDTSRVMHILKMLFPHDYGAQASGRSVHCCYRSNRGNGDWEEWQVETLAAMILLPPECVVRSMERFGLGTQMRLLNRVFAPADYKKFEAMASFMGASKTALSIRMMQLGLLKRNDLSDPYSLVRVDMDEEDRIL